MRSAFLYVVLLHLLRVLTTNGENVNNNTAAPTHSSQVGSCKGFICGYRSFCNRMISSCECAIGSTVELTIHDPSGSNNIRVVYCLKTCTEKDPCIDVVESCIHDNGPNTDRCLCSTGYSRSWRSLGHCQDNNTTTPTHSSQEGSKEEHTDTSKAVLPKPMSPKPETQNTQNDDTSKAVLPKPMSPKPRTQNTQNDDNLTLYIGLGVGFASLVMLVAILIVLVVFLRRRTARQSGMTEPENNTGETIRNNISPWREPRVVTCHGNAEIDDVLKASGRNDYAPDPSEVPAKQTNLNSYDEIVFNDNVPTVIRAVNNTQNPPPSYPHIEAVTDPDSNRPQSFHPYADIDEVMASLEPNALETSRLGNSKTIDDESGTYNTLYQVRVPKSLGTKEIPAIEDTATDYGTTDTGRLNQIREGEKKQEAGASLKPNAPETSRLGNSKTIEDASGTYNTLYQVRVPKSAGTKEIPVIEDTPATDYDTTDTGRLIQIRNGEKKQEAGATKDRLTTEDPYSNHKIAQEKDRIRAAKKENLESIDNAVEAFESADGRPRYSEINEAFNTDESIGTYHTLEEVEVPK